MSTLGERMRNVREKRGWSQTYVCKKLGIPNSTFSGYERDYREPDADTLSKLAKLYEVTTDYLISGDSSFEQLSVPSEGSDSSLPPQEREFMEWVKTNLESSFFYDFNKSADDSKKYMMDTLRMVWEREKGRKPGQKQGE